MHRSLVGLTVATALLFAASSAGLAVRLAGSEHSTPSAGETCQRSGAASPGQAKAILACLSPSLAFIRTPTGTGSGVLVDGRFVVTNAHVVDPFAAVTVVLGGRERHEGVPVKGVDLAADLALVGPVDTRRPTLPLADHAPLEQGDDLFLVGYPGEADEAPDATISRGMHPPGRGAAADLPADRRLHRRGPERWGAGRRGGARGRRVRVLLCRGVRPRPLRP